MTVQVRPARVDEAEQLHGLYRRSASVSESGQRAFAARPDMVEPSDADLAAGRVRVAVADGRIVGFALTVSGAEQAGELDALFVEPDDWRRGVGRALIADAAALAVDAGLSRLDVTANLDAVPFYERVGFVGDGEVPTEFAPARRMHLPLPA